MNNGILIRRLQPHESREYRAMRLACLRENPRMFGSTYEEEAANPKLLFESLIESQDPNDFMLGAFSEQVLCGICGFRREPRVRARHRGELVHMYVAPSAAGKGIGKLLINGVIRTAFENPEIRQIVLSVVAHNQNAIGLYLRSGFREYGRLANYFLDPEEFYTQVFMAFDRTPIDESLSQSSRMENGDEPPMRQNAN